MYVVFDLNKNFISYSDNMFGGNFLFKEIAEEESDILNWRWDGDYDNGKMVKLEDSPYEHNSSTEEAFQEKYPLHIFFTIILKQLFLTSSKNKTVDPLFEQMLKEYIIIYESNDSYISLLKEANKLKS